MQTKELQILTDFYLIVNLLMFLEYSLEFTSTKRDLQIEIIAIQDYNNCLAP